MGAEEKVNILLVDDQPAKLLSYEAILSELGENLVKANSARDALEHLLKIEVAVVLIDVVMPEFDGFELAAMIREHPRFQTLSIIFVSAVQVTDLDLLRGYECGAVDYVPVPVAPELLRSKVRVFCELFRKTRQLETLNAELERRVEERTAELAQANADLEHRVEERTREREAALAQVHEMQKVESLGQLTGGVAHDFNNLLMAVLGNLGLAGKYTADNPKVARLIDSAIKAAERGATLTKRMLAFARRQELKPELVDVPRLVGGMVEMLRHSLGPEIEISTEFRDDLLATRVDPNQLELALLNLALNARDAMPNGGKLVIAARRETVAAGDVPGLAAGEYICISECDNGFGMDEATIARAAEPFFTTKDAGAGTGLGLSMVDGLVAQSGGAMRIKSRLELGTTIELWLPYWQGTEAKPAETRRRRRSAQRSSFQVLLVDDDEMVAAGTLAMIEDLGHTAIEANSAKAALEILETNSDIDIVVTDHAMPGMNGSELARRIRDSWPELPVVLVTGYADLPNGFDPLLPRLSKPYRQQELADLISALGADHRQKAACLLPEQPAAE
ncbi:MAG TPA: response regulator [Stellaceae bacterium]|nr:response regulator [Stellaceae bacterium]